MAAALVANALVTSPAAAGLVQRLTFTFENELPPTSIDLAFPSLTGVCDSFGIRGVGADDCDSGGPTVDVLSGAFGGFEFVYAGWQIGDDWMLQLDAVFNTFVGIPGLPVDPLAVSGTLELGRDADPGEEACFLFDPILDGSGVIDALEECGPSHDRFAAFAAVTAVPLNDPGPTVAVPTPATLAILPPALLALVALHRRRRAP
jgi:hypothetical protein